MSSLANDNLQHLAFAKAMSELANVSICGVIEQLSDTKQDTFSIRCVYVKLKNNKVMTYDGIRNEDNILTTYKNSFTLETDNVEHFLEFTGSDIDNTLFQRSVDNLKSAIVDVYGNVLKQYGILLNT